MPRGRISFTYDASDIFISLHIGVNFVRAAVACKILETASDFEPLTEAIAPRYFKFEVVPSFCSLTLISLRMTFALFIISWGFPAILYPAQVLLGF